MEARALLPGPRIGDFVRMPGEDGLRRFTYDWGDDIQTTWRPNSDGSFYLCAGGGMSYSGSLDPAILKSRLVDTGEVKDGRCWFFHHAFQQAHNGVHTTVPCRVYRYDPPPSKCVECGGTGNAPAYRRGTETRVGEIEGGCGACGGTGFEPD